MHAATPLAATVGLLAGLAAGWALASGGERAPRVEAMRTPSLAPAEARGSAPEVAAAVPPEERAGRRRVAVEEAPGEGARVEEPANLAPVAPDESLQAELTAFLRSGALEALLATEPEAAVFFLYEQYLATGQPQRALDLLARHPSDDPWHYDRLAGALREAGDDVAATEAWLRACELDPFDLDRLQPLCELDPAGALALLEAQAAELGPAGAHMLDLQRARILGSMGRGEEALALARAAVDGEVLDAEAWEVLAELDAAAAEADLRERLAGDEHGGAHLLLATLMLEDETRAAEAVALLEEVLARAPGHYEALELLAGLDPERTLALLERSGAWEAQEPWIWSRAAEALRELGRDADAVDAWLRVLEVDPSDWMAIEGLRELAPQRLWAECQRRTVDTRDDELLGDVADLYWEEGRREEAIELWRRANRLDPGDSEWTGKLRLALTGRDPL